MEKEKVVKLVRTEPRLAVVGGGVGDEFGRNRRIRDPVEERAQRFIRLRRDSPQRFQQSQYKRNCVPDGPKITIKPSKIN